MKYIFLLLLMLIVLFLNLWLGPVDIAFKNVWHILLSPLVKAPGTSSLQYAIIWHLRVLESVEVLLAGFALGLAGCVMQGLLRNPLADPGLLGVSSGIGFCVVLGVVCLGSSVLVSVWSIPIIGVIAGLAVVVLLYMLSEKIAQGHPTALILLGVALNALFSAGTLLVMTLANSEVLQNVFFWELGGVEGSNWFVVGFVSVLLILGSALLIGQGSALNVLSLGETEARYLGVSVAWVRARCLFSVALLVSASVILAGPLAFVGLMVPHVMRGFYGADHRHLLWTSGIAGSVLLLLARLVEVSLSNQIELPIGVLIAFVGAPFFLGLLWRMRTCSLLHS